MALPDIFSQPACDHLIERIEALRPDTQPQWGKMNAAQMLAHCNVTYEMIYTDKHPKPGGMMKLMLKWFVKPTVVNEKPYPQNSRTAPQFLITDEKVFETEKKRLVDHIRQTLQLGRNHFEGKTSHSFGDLNAVEWNNMMYKHLDHHLTQFGV